MGALTADCVQFEYQNPELSWLVGATPRGIDIVETGAQAQQLQIIIEIIFLALAYLAYRQI
jgi:hypothetical protein